MARLRFFTGVSSFSIGSQTFTLSSPRQIVRHADCDGEGVVCIVSSDEVTVTVSPGRTVDGSRTINGGMKNPTHGFQRTQGFDSSGVNWNSGVSVDTGSGVALDVGDTLISALSKGSFGTSRTGTVDEYAGVYVASAAPAASSLAPALVGWTGRTTLDGTGAIDWTAKATALPSYAVSVAAPRTAAELITGLRFNPGPALDRGSSSGYEDRSPYRWANTAQEASVNYGGRWARLDIGTASAMLLSEDLTTSEKVQVLKAVGSFGKQIHDTWTGAEATQPGNGGHFQFHAWAASVYLWLIDDMAGLDDLKNTAGLGSWTQCFEMDSTLAARIVPSSVTSTPYPYRLRKVTAVSGNNVELALTTTGFPNNDPARGSFIGGILVRESDGAEGGVITNHSVPQGGDQTQWGASANPTQKYTVTITSQPTPAFDVDDDVYVRPTWADETYDWVGWIDWSIQETTNFAYYSPLASAVYRGDDAVYFAPQIMFMQALGLITTDMRPARDYIVVAHQANFPAAGDDWYNGQANAYTSAMWSENWASVENTTQRADL